jgi:peptide/nickel transport system substrate-binding protein/oligopeptide transport system substrate-binding protein
MNIVGAAAFRDGKASQVSGLKALDRYTVQVDLTESSTPFVSTLAVGHAKIVPRELVQAQGVAFGLHPIGTGPFKFARWDRAKEILLQANPDYFQGPPKLSGVVYRIFRGEDSDRMCAEFDRGQLEESPVPPLCKAKVGDPGYQYVRRVTFSVRFYGLNTRLKPLGDRRVRQAIAHAIDRPRILQEVFPGRFQPANGILPPGTPGYNPGIRFLPRDVAQAKALLAQAGYPRSGGVPPLAIWSSVKSERITKELALVANQLAEIGIRADVRYDTNWPSFFKRLLAGEFPMFVLAWYADVPDPDNFLFKLFFSQSDRNFTGYTNGSVDDLLSGARRERSFFRRAELYHRAEQLILDDAPIIPLWHYTYERLFQPYVRSVEVNGLGDPYIPLRKVWLEVPR